MLSLIDCINADTRNALELVHANQLYRGRLPPSDINLETFLHSIVPTPTLDDLQPYFEANICMPFASANTFYAHPLTAYNIYYNKFIAAYGLFKCYFEEKMA